MGNMISIDPSKRNSSKERGSQVIRTKMKRSEISFSDTSYQLPQLWQNIKTSNAVNLQDAYFVLEYSTKKSKKKVDDEKGRKVDGSLQYFIAATEKDARDLVKLHLAWTLPKEKREEIFNQICPELAKLESDNLSAAEDADRSMHRQKILRKEGSLKDAELQKKTEKLLDDLFKSEDWSEENRKALRQRFHIEFAMPVKKEMKPRKETNHLVLHSPTASAKCSRFIAC